MNKSQDGGKKHQTRDDGEHFIEHGGF